MRLLNQGGLLFMTPGLGTFAGDGDAIGDVPEGGEDRDSQL